MRHLLVEPEFPIAAKSSNHKDFLPVGLLKIASYLRAQGDEVRLVRGLPHNEAGAQSIRAYAPERLWVTSLFTYWASYVREVVQAYRILLPDAEIFVGGIYASLRPEQEVREYTGCDVVMQGVIEEAEDFVPAYDLAEALNSHPIDFQIVHASRGCPRECPFCGTWVVEPSFIPRRSIKDLVHKPKLVFYDNNLLLNPFIEDILHELAELKRQGRIVWCESQSGFDGRVLVSNPRLAERIKQAGFRHPRIAWDWGYADHRDVYRQVELLLNAGYKAKDIYVFMLYNWELPFAEMEQKRVKCWEWQVQISDCRYRPLDQLVDHYKTRRGIEPDYFICTDAGWTDSEVRQFRRNVREQNICVRHGLPLYSRAMERKQIDRETVVRLKQLGTLSEKILFCERSGMDYWDPSASRAPHPLRDAGSTTLRPSRLPASPST